jgi:hypothetical protein
MEGSSLDLLALAPETHGDASKKRAADPSEEVDEISCKRGKGQQQPLMLQKRGPAGAQYDFYLRFAQSLTLKTWMDVISCVLHDCRFVVACDGAFRGISVETIDPSKICMVQARLAASDLELPFGPRNFCIRTNHLVSSLRGATPQQFVDVWSIKDSKEVQVEAFEPNVSSFSQRTTIRELQDCEDSAGCLDSMRYEIYVEIDLTNFRNAVKAAKDHKVQTLQLAVYVPRKDEGMRATSRVTTFFTMRFDGDEVSSVITHQSSSEPAADGSGGTSIRATDGTACEFSAIPPEDELSVLFRERYLVEYLMHFVKAMERHTLTLRLAPGLPLLLEYPFGGGSENFIRFVLAPFAES